MNLNAEHKPVISLLFQTPEMKIGADVRQSTPGRVEKKQHLCNTDFCADVTECRDLKEHGLLLGL